MNLFDRLREHIDAVRLPLFAVTVTAAAQVNMPLIAILHWHGFRRATPLVLPGVDIHHDRFRALPSRSTRPGTPLKPRTPCCLTLPGSPARGRSSALSSAAAT
jgi:hypothetical protein